MTSAPLIDAMRNASTLLQAGDFRAAHDRLEILVRDNPDFAEAQRLFAGAKLALGDNIGAEQLLRQALALAPDWTPTLATLGELLLNSGRSDEAESLLKRAVAGVPTFPRAALLLARFYNDSRRPEQALAIAAPFCAGANADPELVVQHVNALAALGRQDEAVAGYRRIVDTSPDSPAAAQALAIALEAANAHDDAQHIAQRTLNRGFRSAALHYTHARSLISLGEFDRAETALRDCLRLEPHRVDAHGDLARLVWMRSGDIAQSTATLDLALNTFPNNDALWAAKAAVLQGAGDARGAYACLASRTAHAHAPPALLVRAGLSALEFDPASARDLAERVLRVLPNDMAARKLLVAALLGVGDARDALPHCEALLVQSPDDQYLIALETTAWRLIGDSRYARLCDYPALVLPQQLEAPPEWSDLTGFLDDVKRSLHRLHRAHDHPLLFQSLRHGTETTTELTRSDDPVIQALFKSFDAPIRQYLAHIGHGNDPLRRRNTDGYRFNGSWSVQLHSAGFHNNHVHPRGWISSACYIDLPDCMADAKNPQGALTFGEPSVITKPALRPEYSVRPEVGMLVLFPSYVWHGTVPFASAQTRLTVAFDAVPNC